MRLNLVKECLDELVRIRQLLQTMSQVQEQCLQVHLDSNRLLRRLTGTPTGEQPAIRPPPIRPLGIDPLYGEAGK